MRADSLEALYLDLLKKSLSCALYEQSPALQFRPIRLPADFPRLKKWRLELLQRWLSRKGMEVVQRKAHEPRLVEEGYGWPDLAHTMIGIKRLDNLQACCEDVIRKGVPGDFIETGVWRGGATIFMRGLLKAHGVTDRTVWAADSFAGLPPPDIERFPQERGDLHHTVDFLNVSLEDVKSNFAKYGLLDEQVRFLVGWFKDTLPRAPISRLAILRLDGDMYGSTMDALEHLYPKLSPGGFVIVDDYALEGARQAVHDYRRQHGITEEMVPIDWTSIYWRRGTQA